MKKRQSGARNKARFCFQAYDSEGPVTDDDPETCFSLLPCPSCRNEAQKEEYERPEGRFLQRYFRVTCWHCGYLYDSGDFDNE